MTPIRILCVVGARPNFMKMAPIVHAMERKSGCFAPTLVHTGQHYDEAMSRVFFEELGIPRPDVDLNVGSGSHAAQTAAIMKAFEPVLVDRAPQLVMVVGDVNSTIACALVAVKLGIPVAHVEAGLRSFDRSMPEEINRLLTDQISDFLFTTEASAEANLLRENISREKIFFVGNVMIDTLLAHREKARRLDAPARLGLKGPYGLMTLHRPANVDDTSTFDRMMTAIAVIARDIPLIFPVHPRTRPSLMSSAVTRELVERGRLRLLDPLGYLDFIGLMESSAVVLTDSGGIQEETTILGVPCLTLRDNTERPVTITNGTNRLAGTSPDRILAAWASVNGRPASPAVPPMWDGHAADRITDVLAARLESENPLVR
jgi:UDP-N-acetylglucosamine 2-epimerase (non-hydrolysing)